MSEPSIEWLFDQARQARELLQSRSSVLTLQVYDRPGTCPHDRQWTDEVAGDVVCVQCGLVLAEGIISRKEFYGDAMTIHRKSVYKRIHYFNERIQQWQCSEPVVPPEVIKKVAELIEKTNGPLTKTKIRTALRAIKESKYNERWLQIYCNLTGHRVPTLPPQATEALRAMFILWESAFRAVRPESRTCMINYNYLFTRGLQYLHLPEHFKYFPTLKSRSKVRVLDEIWGHMCKQLGIEFRPLPTCKTLR